MPQSYIYHLNAFIRSSNINTQLKGYFLMQHTRFRASVNLLIVVSLLLTAAAVLLLSSQPLLAQDNAEATEVPGPAVTEEAGAPPGADSVGGHFGQNCGECHLDFRAAWAQGAHAIAYERESFQAAWAGVGNDPTCLECHVTLFEPATGRFLAENIQCEACHGLNPDDHPPAAVTVNTEARMCGSCHENTFTEWRLSLHAFNDDLGAIGCATCHNPHGQQTRFETNELCLNCHKNNPEVTHEYANSYVHLTHNEVSFEGVDVTCASCHMYRRPSDEIHNLSNHTMNVSTVPCTDCHESISVLGTSPLIVPIDAALAEERDKLRSQLDEAQAELAAVREAEAPPAGTNFIQLTQGLIIGLGIGATLFLVLRQRSNGGRRSGPRNTDGQ